jgi:hypothetical protein
MQLVPLHRGAMDPFYRYTPRQQADLTRQLSTTQEELRESQQHSKSLTDALAAAHAREEQVANEAAALRNKLAAAKPEETEDVLEEEAEIAADDAHRRATGAGAVAGGASGGGGGEHVFVEFPESLKPLPSDADGDDGGAAVCGKAQNNAEFWGDVVQEGHKNIQTSADACCQSCRNAGRVDKTKRQCTVWVWSPTSNHCWLKHDDNPNPKPHDSGPHVDWTSGVVGLYKLNPLDPELESAWFQPLSL